MKTLLVKKYEKYDYVTDLRRFIVNHPLLVLEMGFHPVGTKTLPYDFDAEETVPCDRRSDISSEYWITTFSKKLFRKTVHDLQDEIPGLGDTSVIDTKNL